MEITSKDVLDRMPPVVQKKVVVLTPSETGLPLALHISDNLDIRKFVPRISTRGITDEDRSIPRISVSLSLSEAIAGHQSTDDIFKYNNDSDGTFQVYGFDYEHIVRPTAALVGDAHKTKEYWLTSYSKDTMEYIPKKIAKFFYSTITIHRLEHKTIYEFYIAVPGNTELWITPKLKVTGGYHRIVGTSTRSVTRRNIVATMPMVIDEHDVITKATYDEAKQANVFSMESIGPMSTFNW